LTINGKNYRNARRRGYCYYGNGERWWIKNISVFVMHGRRKAKLIQREGSIQTHTKTAEPIEMPFGIMSRLGPRNSVLRGGDDQRRRRGNFGGKHVPDKPIPPIFAIWTGPCSGTRQGQTLDCKHWRSLLSAAKWAFGLKTAGGV